MNKDGARCSVCNTLLRRKWVNLLEPNYCPSCRKLSPTDRIKKNKELATLHNLKVLDELLKTPFDDNGIMTTSVGVFKTIAEVQAKVARIMGRTVYAHELAHPEFLYQELKSGDKGSAILLAMDELAKTKPVTIIKS